MTSHVAGPARCRELAARLDELRLRIDRACAEAGRAPAEVILVAVSKTWPATDVAALAALGVADFGENKHQEALAKVQALTGVTSAGVGLRWHFVGRLQSNKARQVAAYADVVHSVDRAALLDPLDRGAAEAGRTLQVLLQVSLDGNRARGGALAEELAALADHVATHQQLRLAGLMAVVPAGASPRPCFARLRGLAERLQRQHPQARTISAGMSGDLTEAVAEGATVLRVGTALFGGRPPVLR